MSLPTFEECESAVNDGTANPLQRFIHENEPAGLQDEADFRNGLTELVEFLSSK